VVLINQGSKYQKKLIMSKNIAIPGENWYYSKKIEKKRSFVEVKN